ncbi:hypothetical protein PsYK624_163850 [Phanerochaete sordida]|uniref:Uncharacterized protein n=1 Tax=Phanerochaete sordida TaxID=48140 RepID=A0A9P3LM68_9APHY|nr:hypothetical protein PsYK624_163850 [Phanerochaete sordida]
MTPTHPAPGHESEWLAHALAQLLAAPHISVDEGPDEGAASVDVFTSRFDELFVPEARGIVCGHAVDRAALKRTLAGLQRRWDAAEGACVGCAAHPAGVPEFNPTMAAKVEFTPLYLYPRTKETIMAEASGEEIEGVERIDCLMLEGDEYLFRPEA